MLNQDLKFNKNLFTENVNLKSTRQGYGDALVELGEKNLAVVVLSADLTESTRSDKFVKKFPKRFVQVGVAEQNMAGIAAGLALCGKIPFMASHAVFSPGRNWEQIRLSIGVTDANVKIIGSHSGFSNGPDGLPDQSLEDIAITRVLPNMAVINPIDYEQTKKAVFAAVEWKGPVYLRLAKEATPEITTSETFFDIGRAQVLKEGKDVTVISCGPITYQALLASKKLREKDGIEAEVVACPTIKPLDKATLVKSLAKTKKCVTVEEHQIIGGLGSAVAELIAEQCPGVLLKRVGMQDRWGESGKYLELLEKYNMDWQAICNTIKDLL